MSNYTSKIYKRDGYEFQVVESCGDVSRAVGRKGKYERHEVITPSATHAYDSEGQARRKFKQLTDQ